VGLSEPVVEAGVYDAAEGTALVFANFTYEPVAALRVEVPTRTPVAAVTSASRGAIPFETVAAPPHWAQEGYPHVQRFTIPLGMDDVILLAPR
jgi:hypothetical protein